MKLKAKHSAFDHFCPKHTIKVSSLKMVSIVLVVFELKAYVLYSWSLLN